MVAAILAGKDLTVFKPMPLRFSLTFGASMNMTIPHLEKMFQAGVIVWELFKEIANCLFCHADYITHKRTCV